MHASKCDGNDHNYASCSQLDCCKRKCKNAQQNNIFPFYRKNKNDLKKIKQSTNIEDFRLPFQEAYWPDK